MVKKTKAYVSVSLVGSFKRHGKWEETLKYTPGEFFKTAAMRGGGAFSATLPLCPLISQSIIKRSVFVDCFI